MYGRSPARLNGVRVPQMLFQLLVHCAALFARVFMIRLSLAFVSMRILLSPCLMPAARYGSSIHVPSICTNRM
jgi:hypothetical protein